MNDFISSLLLYVMCCLSKCAGSKYPGYRCLISPETQPGAVGGNYFPSVRVRNIEWLPHISYKKIIIILKQCWVYMVVLIFSLPLCFYIQICCHYSVRELSEKEAAVFLNIQIALMGHAAVIDQWQGRRGNTTESASGSMNKGKQRAGGRKGEVGGEEGEVRGRG